MQSTTIKTDNIWTLSNDAQWIGGLDKMFVRNCYIQIADKVLNETTKRSLILGIKGIGKTDFINYLIFRIVDKHRMLNIPTPTIVYTWKPDEIIVRIRFSDQGVNIMSFASTADYYLSDSVDIGDSTLGKNLLLEVASNDPANYRRFTDRMAEGGASAYRCHMPPWSLDELLLVNPYALNFTQAVAEFLFNMFGGCIRYFISQQGVHERKDDFIQRNAEWFFGIQFSIDHPSIWNWSINEIRNRIEKATVSSRLLVPDREYISGLFWNPHIHIEGENSYISGYTSPFMKFLAGCLKDEAEASLWNSLKELFGGSGEGVAFESVGHRVLVSTKQNYTAFNMNPLARKNKKYYTINFFQYPRVLFRSVEDISLLPVLNYGLPLSCNFALVDAIIQPDIMLQFTIAKTHGKSDDTEKYKPIRDQLQGAWDSHKLIFILKPENMDSFRPVGIPADLTCYKMTYVIDSKKRTRS